MFSFPPGHNNACPPRFGRLLACLSLSALVACGGSSDAGGSGTAEEEVQWAINYLKSDYLWTDQLPDSIDPAAYTSGETVLEGLRVSQDRYSSITTTEAFDSFFIAGQITGFGFNFRYENDNIRIYGVQPNAPAAAAGLLRGDLITAINDKPTAQWISEGAIDEALGPSEPGIERSFSITRGPTQSGQPTEISLSITKATYSVSYVPASGLFELGSRKVGYLNFYSFADPGVVPWRTALDDLLARGAQDLIVDLRFNGGGLISTAAQIGSALGTQSLAGQPMTYLTYNSQRSGSNNAFRFSEDARAGRFANLVWLTSESTCSASEALILGIDPYRQATRIGAPTCGKPVGFTPQRFNGKVFSIVTFRLENPLGVSDYFDGLTPDCLVTDSGLGVLGQADEPLTAAALQFLQSGSCPPTSADSTTVKSTRPTPAAYGFESLTNLR
ncbi:MAG: S41 family peptidase [Burkholderiaceae bacterium]